MLEPRESDIPVLLLVLVVFPLIAYILLGKWNETSKKKDRINQLAFLAAEEAFKQEAMTAVSTSVISDTPSPINIGHVCARCTAPATTRCSQCKSVRYCSGKCQIIHWRQVHKHECLQIGRKVLSPSPVLTSSEFLQNGNGNQQLFLDANMNQMNVTPFSDDRVHQSSGSVTSTEAGYSDTSEIPTMERRSKDKRGSRRSKLRDDGATLDSSEETTSNRAFTSYNFSGVMASDELNNADCMHQQEGSLGEPGVDIYGTSDHGPSAFRTTHQEIHLESNSSTNVNINGDFSPEGGCLFRNGFDSNRESAGYNCSETTLTKRSNKGKSSGTKSHVSVKEQLHPETHVKRHDANETKARQKDNVIGQGNNKASSMGIMKMIGMRKSSKLGRQETHDVSFEKDKKLMMLFPYEEFMKFFQYEIIDLSPRGLINCGNSCYANAVLQCLTSTKPLTVYLLQRQHSRFCCVRKWCLMCELEEHVTKSRESRGPLSPSRILSKMQSSNCHIGNGSQEDAHEFLRLLVTSMQSICLEGLGGEDAVEPRLQETTFIQYAFGGRLKSKVKCLRCFHESERYENIMDLTLEIYGWVESLEDALTQFTTPEELDGDNMYRCGKCSAYVRARKQLKIHEAPNILTIVLKRFQEGSYGKISKCITFPDMLDMIPYMTGEDTPPLYMLYGVIVHVDTLNASFSGHYVSYVKDLLGNWYRVDDTEVQSVQSSQVMSEGAYILFYKRSCPRPARKLNRHSTSKSEKQSRSKANVEQFVNNYEDLLQSETKFSHHTSSSIEAASAEPLSMEFSEATLSSDWSMFTSSDESSFTTESTRDSFSNDSFSSIFDNLYGQTEYNNNPASQRTVKCSMSSGSKPLTRFDPDRNGFVASSYLL
ncbi:ubiquitin carboxyl-terminal hydrolase 15-like [Impatiens glandulifera]|uniref:ubiquitin carboxyl-terminal hydrolase 15-like n=1 Tax=Impatiens glandulifera TaxID=253017 RepID=UPI001FB13C20|nr:ubiquitin carboxyl-terminal hydrolase 15-like [Impatiens glandulifera]